MINENEKYILELSSKKIGLIIIDKEITLNKINKDSAVILSTKDKWMNLQKHLCDQLYPIPSGLKFIGVTGTNGKTSTVNFARQILNQKKINNITIGTLGVTKNENKVNDFSLTSPSYIDFRKTLYVNSEKNYVIVFEMSSHALDQKRFFEIKLNSAGWTSFTQDHLDYHKTMEEYFNAKAKIFDYLEGEKSYVYVPDSQDILWKMLTNFQSKIRCKSWDQYMFKGNNDLFKANFSRDNFIVAYELVASICGIKSQEIKIESIKTADGRWVLKKFQNKTVVIDYAHTPDALTNVCSNVYESYKGLNIKVLFGCGGDRDRSKRPLMGKAVSEFATFVYVTSDNPRTEDPEKIIDDIMPEIKIPFYRNADRETTLKKALSELMPNEVLIVAGKGHENYIIKGTTKFPYSDEKVCDDFIKMSEKSTMK